MNKKAFVFILVAVVVLVSGFFAYRSRFETKISDFELSATASDAAGVAQNSRFVLKSSEELSPQVLEKYIKISPEVGFEVRRMSQANTFELVPSTELEADKIYTIAIGEGPLADHDFSWAYQVKAPFQIVSSIPADKGIGVPLNSGIEIDFNRDNIVNPRDFIEIAPATPGRFEVKGNKVRFIPDSPLKENFIYTVTVNEGLSAKDTEDVLSQKAVIRFETSQSYNPNSPYAYFTRNFSEYAPDSSIDLGLSVQGAEAVSITVYRFDTAEEFIDSAEQSVKDHPWARSYRDIDTAALESRKIFSGLLPTRFESSSYYSTVRLPADLDEGYYMAYMRLGEKEDVTWFQVNGAASLSAFSGEKSLVWLKEIASGNPVVNEPIFFEGREIGKTGSDGVALFATPEEMISKDYSPYTGSYASATRFLVARRSPVPLVIPTENEYGYTASIRGIDDRWWDYISLNKSIFLPTDTVKFWAVLKPRDESVQTKEVTVTLSAPYWRSNEETLAYAETRAAVSDFGAVTGELSYSDLRPGVYDLVFKSGDEEISRQTLTVASYVKPAYKITLVPEKNAVFAGEEVKFKVKAEFFDGTPLSGISLRYRAYNYASRDVEGVVVLDKNGESTIPFTPGYADDRYWPFYGSMNVEPALAEEGDIRTHAFVLIFGPRIHNTIEQKQTASSATFTIKTRNIELKGLEGSNYWNVENYLGSPASGVMTKVEAFEIIYNKKQTGTGYDAINKTTYPVYEYSTEEKPISTETVTSDRAGLAQYTLATEKQKTYKVKFTAYDQTEKKTSQTLYVYGGYPGDEFMLKDARYSLESAQNKPNGYKIGDKIDLQLQTYSGAVPSDGWGKYIFITVKNGDMSYTVSDSPRYSGKFDAKNVPNVGIWPGWFHGGRFYSSYVHNVSFDAEERRLDISVSKSKPAYAPGEDVTLDIRVTDKNGRPVSAEVNLSALDEAVFTLKPDERDIANDLYRDIFSQVVIRASNMPPYGGGGAEKGGGDGDRARSDIQEMALWKSVVTDISGRAKVDFKIPDNITSWRLTSQAVTKDLYAGKSVDFLKVTLPFFVDATLNRTYLEGDKLVLRLRSFGAEHPKGEVAYSVEGPMLPSKIMKKGAGSADIPLGALALGKHEVKVSAASEGKSDTLVREINVVKGYFTKFGSRVYEGKRGVKIEGGDRGYTTLSFSSYGKGLLYNELASLSYQSGQRIDQTGAKEAAREILASDFGEKIEEAVFKSEKYQANTGGLRLLPYSSEDLELSALGAHLLSRRFDVPALRSYLYRSLEGSLSDRERTAQALFGLAAFKEPVLIKLQKLRSDKALSVKGKIYVGLALSSLGAKEEARRFYVEEIMPDVENKGSYAYIRNLSGDEAVVSTTLLSALAASIDAPETSALARYSLGKYPRETLSNFERLLYVREQIPNLSDEEVSFTFSVGDKKIAKSIKNGEKWQITLSRADLSKFELIEASGKLAIVASYEEASSPDSMIKDGNLSISRTYSVKEAAASSLKDGDTVKIEFRPSWNANAQEGMYQIVDYLPSGLRATDKEVDSEYPYGRNRIGPVEINDQRVTFIVSKNDTLPIYYLARVVSKGEYKAEPALLQSMSNLESVTLTDEKRLIIE